MEKLERSRLSFPSYVSISPSSAKWNTLRIMMFSFGHSKLKRIEVEVLGYERAPVGEFWDDNWLRAEIQVAAGGFRGHATAEFITSELSKFLSELRPLFETLKGKAEFSTIEEQLKLQLVGDGKGHIALTGEIADQPGIGNRLLFAFEFDQSQLGASIHELEQVTSRFPVRVP
jgi:hypothetical protein